jgi:glycosyltransferase involved in cell wall biosynthesis
MIQQGLLRSHLTWHPPTCSARPISVCFMIDGLSRAGTETQLLALIRSLDRSHVQPSLCLLNGIDAESQALLPDCPVLCLGAKSLLSWHRGKTALQLKRFWRQQRVDVLQTYFLDSTYFSVPLARLCGIRKIVRVRNNIGYWLNTKHRRLGWLMGRLAHTTLTNSADAARAIHTSERLGTERIRVLENGVDLERFPNPAPPFQQQRIRIGAVANLRPVKNIAGLIRSAKTIIQRFPNVEFDVAGEGDLRGELEEQIGASGHNERFRLRGSVSDIPRYLASLDVAVLCSHSESMSNALLEYMAAGRAIVATDVGANAKLVAHQRAGLIVPPRDDEALATALMKYLEQPTFARTCAEEARKRAETHYSRAQMVRNFEEFYRQLIGT